MYTTTEVQLKTTSILKIPLNIYGNFSFIVNGEEFQTSQIISDILSQKICQIHACDPTFNEFIIKTSNKGDFSNVLKLLNFEKNIIPENEIPFISEVFELLDNDCIEFDKESCRITQDNVINLIENHQKFQVFYSKSLFDEIDFFASNFSDIIKLTENEEEMKKIDLNILERIINNPKLVLDNEDQLLDFVNRFYMSDSKYSNLYECVLFQNVELSSINEFLTNFNINDLTSQTWRAVSNRLKQKIDKNPVLNSKYRYRYRMLSIIIYIFLLIKF
ncbi:hypothetical protein M9Y10_031994 [Tritrichomonas musculus]|uniref:BTB domain-containing protein n=1 Tax=Tritrichomonas musculus TaxID=1915356 RepID=A0ABR2H160_9EUKA